MAVASAALEAARLLLRFLRRNVLLCYALHIQTFVDIRSACGSLGPVVRHCKRNKVAVGAEVNVDDAVAECDGGGGFASSARLRLLGKRFQLLTVVLVPEHVPVGAIKFTPKKSSH